MRCLALIWICLPTTLARAEPASSGHDGVLAADLAVDKKDDAWTTSSRFKHDLVEMFSASKAETVLELGAHVGHCTRILAQLFGSVIAVEHSTHVLGVNVNRTRDLGNVVHLRFHTVLDDWDIFAHSRTSVVFIDAAHDYHSVRNDIQRSLALPAVHTLVLDDYGAERGVRDAVTAMVEEGFVSVRRFVGEAPPWHFSDRTIEDWEGVVLEPQVHGARAVPALDSLPGTEWIVFPPGVFMSGFFQPHGKITFLGNGFAQSSYGVLAWSVVPQSGEHPDTVELGDDMGIVMQLQEPPHWQAELRFNAQGTAGVLFRSDGHEAVMLRQAMMRTIGEKLVSFMH